MEAIGTLAGGIAHDFNNLLCIIICYTKLTVEALEPGIEERDNLETVLAASERARDLVRQILSFSRKGERHPIPLDVAAAVRDSLRLLHSTIPKTALIEQELLPDASYAVIDPIELHRVVMNLATNAFHSLNGQTGRVKITVKPVEVGAKLASTVQGLEAGAFVALEVEDSGEGMNAETLARIFEPYFTTKGLGNGTGLGLAVTQGIVLQTGGAVAVRSVPGKGSVFTVYFPRCERPGNPAVEARCS